MLPALSRKFCDGPAQRVSFCGELRDVAYECAVREVAEPLEGELPLPCQAPLAELEVVEFDEGVTDVGVCAHC